jgi:hypothetical protein
MIEDHIAVAVGVGNTPLIRKEGSERSRGVERMRQLLVLPIRELLIVTSLVIGDGNIVEPGRIKRLAIDLQQ